MTAEQLQRYARYLFDSIPGALTPPYLNHRFHGNMLCFITEEHYELFVDITEDDTHITVSEKLLTAYDQMLDMESALPF